MHELIVLPKEAISFLDKDGNVVTSGVFFLKGGRQFTKVTLEAGSGFVPVGEINGLLLTDYYSVVEEPAPPQDLVAFYTDFYSLSSRL